MNIPKLRFPGFVGEWEEKKLGSVSDVRDGTHDSPKYVSHGYPFVTSKNLLASGEIDFSAVNYISQIDYDNFNKRSIVEVGDILFGMIGTIGNAVIVKSAGFAIKNVALVKQSEQLLNSFLLTYLFSPILVKRITDSQVGGTQQFVSLSTIRNLIVALPSLEEQQKIATFLSSVDNVIQLLTKKKTLLENYKKGIMQKIFSQEIRFKDEDANDFPDWEEELIGDALEYEQPTPYLVTSTEYRDEYEIPVLTAGKSFILGYTNEKYGVYEALPVVIFDDFTTSTQFVSFPFKAKSSAMKILKANNGHNIRFMFSCLQNLKYEVGGHERHWISKFSTIPVLIPSLPEQQKIADFLSGIDRTIEIINSQIEKTKEYKKGLLQQMFV